MIETRFCFLADASASSAGEVPAGGRSNKKGKKNKPKVLFATGMNFM